MDNSAALAATDQGIGHTVYQLYADLGKPMAEQPSSVTYSQIKKLIEKGFTGENKLIDAVSGLLGAAMVVTALTFGPVGAAVLSWFDAESEVIALVKKAAKKLATMRGGDFLERSRRMATAEFLITYAAFFEALRREFPELMAKIDITATEQNVIVAEHTIDSKASSDDETFLVSHPALSPEARREARKELYASLSRGFASFVEGLAIADDLGPREIDRFRANLERIPDLASNIYDAQYLDLATEYPQFYIWTSLHETMNAQQLTAQLSDKFASQVAKIAELSAAVDIGMKGLAAAVQQIGVASTSVDTPDAVLEALNRRYAAEVDKPVIEDRYAGSNGQELNYPRKSDIFVPQAFKVVRYSGPQSRLEDEQQWNSVSGQDGLGTFLVSYLQSAYSTETPLLVLGHPGSGKSLLTEIIASQLAPPAFNPVRIELRDIKPDTSLQTQLEEQIRLDTGLTINWASFAEGLAENPPLVILDGYDELLQASGKVFADYLTEVQKFQWREALQGRPIRVLLTSRITLIDKAAIPVGTTVMRLLDFDEHRRANWTRVWNDHNRPYFAATSTKQFELPNRPEVLDLAKQPLLLLMLALYDSQKNELHRHAVLDQSLLYHSLLTRFVVRERSKGEGAAEFATLAPDEQEAQVDQDLARLGVAAIGMFNRQNVHISREELDKDVEYFELTRDVSEGSGRRLTQADLLLGSFFFIHGSRSRSDDGDEPQAPKSFEFLHNTFGEFLAADFLLRQLLDETRTVSTLSGDESLTGVLHKELQEMPDSLLACLIHSPLHSRPVVFQMLREWTPHRLQLQGRTLEEFLTALDKILRSQVRDLLFGTEAPAVARRQSPGPYRQLPLMGHEAIYTLNLILLRTALAPAGFTFNDELIGGRAGQCRPWDRLTHLWQSWLSIDELIGISAVVTASRNGSSVILKPKDEIVTPSRISRLEDILTVSESLADNVTSGLAGLVFHEAHSTEGANLSLMGERLESEQIDVASWITAIRARRTPELLTDRDSDLQKWLLHRKYEFPTPGWIFNALPIVQQYLSGVHTFNLRVGASVINDLISLSRHEARLVIDFRVRFEGRWLDDFLGQLKDSPESIALAIERPMGAPLLWATCRVLTQGETHRSHGLSRQWAASLVNEMITSARSVGNAVDAETCIALTAAADATGLKKRVSTAFSLVTKALRRKSVDILSLSDRSLDFLIDQKLDLPKRLEDALYDGFLEHLVTNRDDMYERGWPADQTPIIKLALICSSKIHDQRDFLAGLVGDQIRFLDLRPDSWPASELLLIRLVRNVNEERLTALLIRELETAATEPMSKKTRNIELILSDLVQVAKRIDELAMAQLNDLAWLAEKIGAQKSLNDVRAALLERTPASGG